LDLNEWIHVLPFFPRQRWFCWSRVRRGKEPGGETSSALIQIRFSDAEFGKISPTGQRKSEFDQWKIVVPIFVATN
jgi:hypothetical protein